MSGPRRPRGILDTPVVIDYRNAVPGAMTLIAEIREERLPEFSQITALALYAWCETDEDTSGIREFLKISTVHPITADIGRRATRLLDRLRPPVTLSPADALVAATALAHKLPLYTLDPAEFAAVPGLTAIRPY